MKKDDVMRVISMLCNVATVGVGVMIAGSWVAELQRDLKRLETNQEKIAEFVKKRHETETKVIERVAKLEKQTKR